MAEPAEDVHVQFSNLRPFELYSLTVPACRLLVSFVALHFILTSEKWTVQPTKSLIKVQVVSTSLIRRREFSPDL